MANRRWWIQRGINEFGNGQYQCGDAGASGHRGDPAVEALRRLNAEVVARVVGFYLHARTLTIDVDGFFTSITVKKWERTIDVAIYRKRVFHETRKNYQLDLFDPDNGTWEYSAVATNLGFDVRRLWRFMAGRGLHEKIIGELKSALALDTIPTNHYEANSAWQQFVVLAHNLLANFQIETGVIERPRTHQRTAHWVLRSAQTLRFEIINRAGRLVRPEGRLTLRLQRNKQAERQFDQIGTALGKAA